MSELDDEIRRLLEQGMREAAPDRDTEERVLRELLKHVPHDIHGPDDGGAAAEPPAVDGGATAAQTVGLSTTAKGLAAVFAAATAIAVTAALLRPSVEAPSRGVEERTADDREPPGDMPLGHALKDTPPAAEIAPALPPTRGPDRREPPPAQQSRTRSHSPAAQPSPTVAADSLAAELSLLDAAERALSSGQYERALSLAREHARAHPSGQLTAERRAIEASALCAAGDPRAPATFAALVRDHGSTAAVTRARVWCGDEKPEP